ncbi:MAG: rRNA pseudouridine synthase [Muribaculaceae bacterium]|nr:rRNA pseudouridine synthase [Muribaculaceae bacterium]
MENEEKKPKRPRIGQPRTGFMSGDLNSSRYEKVSYGEHNQAQPSNEGPDSAEQNAGESHGFQPRYQGGYQQRPYQPRQGGYQQRPYQQRQGGYQQRPGGYQQRNQQGGYQQRPYQPRPYQQRPYGDNQNYNNENRQPEEGYQNNELHNNEGGYQQRPYQQRQGGYQQRPYQQRQGGYQPRQGGYQQRQGGYQQRNQQGGYQQRQGGYQQRNQQGGYQQRNQQGGFRQQQPRPGKSFVPRPKRIEYEMPIPDPNEQIRLNKFMANAGICSRREADEFIQQGLVKVNGNVVTELGTKISHSDVVEYDEKVVALESKCYILLNKPKDCVTTSDDPNGRLTVMDLVKGACPERIYPVGRLDRNTTGVLLLTNDGDLASKLTHPKYVKKKIYHVWTDKDISEEDMQRIADGIELEDGPIHADAISYATETDRNQAGIEIHSGRNRIVRRIFESLGYHVTKLDRVYFAGLTKKNLPRGRWRYLTQEEVNFLKMGSFE